ncbi:MAG: hypothetical protein ACI83O_000141 [Patescibacteria group bacterium]|jgi:hypothetical protein
MEDDQLQVQRPIMEMFVGEEAFTQNRAIKVARNGDIFLDTEYGIKATDEENANTLMRRTGVGIGEYTYRSFSPDVMVSYSPLLDIQRNTLSLNIVPVGSKKTKTQYLEELIPEAIENHSQFMDQFNRANQLALDMPYDHNQHTAIIPYYFNIGISDNPKKFQRTARFRSDLMGALNNGEFDKIPDYIIFIDEKKEPLSNGQKKVLHQVYEQAKERHLIQ